MKVGETKFNYRCAECKGYDLSYPAHTIWSYNDQKYIIDETYYSEGSCSDCGECCHIEELTLTYTENGWEITKITVINNELA